MPVPVPVDAGKRQLSSSRYLSLSSPRRVAPASEEESFKSVWRTVRKRRSWIVWFALGGIGLAVLVCIFLPNQYLSTATVQVGKDQTVQVELSSEGGGPTLSQSDTKTDIATHMAVLTDDSTALEVIKDLNLEQYKPFHFKPTILGAITGSNAEIERELNLPLSDAPARRDRLVKLFSKKLEVKNPPDTRLITVSFLNPNPQLSAQIANDVVRQYVKFESAGSAGGFGLSLLNDDLEKLRAKRDQDQTNLAEYERQTGLNNLVLKSMGEGSGGGNITHIPVLDKLDTVNQELTTAEANRIGKEAIYDLTKTHNSDVVAGLANSSIPAIATSAVITQGNGLEVLQNLRQQQGQLRLEYSADVTKYGEKNPRIVQLQSELVNIDKQISDELMQIDLRAKNDYQVARQNENGLRASFQQQQSAASQLNQSAVNLQVLVQQAASSRQLYDSLYQQIQEAGVQAGLRATNLRLTDGARPHSKPKRPNPPLYVAIGLAAGLLFGVSSAFVREHMDETVKTPLQVDPLTPLPVLASIPRISGSHRQKTLPGTGSIVSAGASGESSALLMRPRSATAEAYRALRTSIILASAGRRVRTLMVTSPLVGEGKTSVSYNTAIAFAHAGERVLLIDADLHHPQLHDFFGKKQTPGLSDVLSGDKTIESAIQVHPSVSNLSLLAAGSLPAHPAELLASAAFDVLLEGLKQKYTMVILDTPPMLLVADSLVLADKADATLAVIRADMTNRTALERMAELLERNGSHAIGIVLNGVDTTSIDYYHAYGHKGGDRYFKEA
jgi:polysaccharide biosynthesis transport protein